MCDSDVHLSVQTFVLQNNIVHVLCQVDGFKIFVYFIVIIFAWKFQTASNQLNLEWNERQTNVDMSSGFVTETELAEARKKRQEEWEKVRQPDDPIGNRIIFRWLSTVLTQKYFIIFQQSGPKNHMIHVHCMIASKSNAIKKI